MITLDLNHFGFCGRGGQRGGEDGEKKEAKVRLKEGILAPGPTSMVVSWIAETPRGLTRVIIRGGFEQSGDCLEAQGPCDHRCEAHRREAIL